MLSYHLSSKKTSSVTFSFGSSINARLYHNRSWKGHIMQQPADFLSECVKIWKSFFSAGVKKSNTKLPGSTAFMLNTRPRHHNRFFQPVGFSHHSFYPVALNWRGDCFFAHSKKNRWNPGNRVVLGIERGIYHFQKIAFQTSSSLEQERNQ